MDRVFLWISGSMILAILSSYYFHLNTSLICILFIFICLYSFYNIMREKLNNFVIIIIFLFLGIFLESYSSNSNLINHVDKMENYSGIVDEVVEDTPNKEKYIILVDSIGARNIPREKTLITIFDGEPLDIGWRVDFSSKLIIPNRNTNPNLFNYRQYLLSKGIYTTGSVKKYNILNIERTSSTFYTLKKLTIKRVNNLYDNYLDIRNASIIKSMLLGDSTYINEGDLNNYRELGLAHILAISGLHIGIISGFLLFLFSRLGIRPRVNILMTLIIIWIYAFIVGFPPSILRANIMLTILLYSQLFHEPYDIINAIFFAMFILLVLNPYSIFSVGFILSFVATLSIVILTPRIMPLFYPYENKIIQSLSAILGVQIGLFPVTAYYFNSISLLSIVGNLLIIPILSLGIVLGFIMFFVGFIFPGLNLFLGAILNPILTLQFSLVDLLSSFYFKDLIIASPNIFARILYYVFIFLFFRIISIERLNKRVINSICIYLVIFILISFTIIILDEKVELDFIDVGQGDSLLIRSSKCDYLVDTGGTLFGDFDIGKNITLPYLEKLGVKKLKGVFITHFHEDHYQGLYSLLGKVDIDNIFASYIPEENPIIQAIDNQEIPIILLNSGDRINLDKDLNMEVIWSGEHVYSNENNMSLVSILNFKDHKVLLTGDMEREVEAQLVDSIIEDIDIIKVPHHGSHTSSTRQFLSKVNPDFGIISVGRNNMYNHPNEEVLNTYEDMGTKIYRTDEMGRVQFILRDGAIDTDLFLERNIDIEFFLLYYCLYFVLSYILVRVYYGIERRKDFEL